MIAKQNIKKDLDNICKFNFINSYKKIEKFLNKNNILFFKDYSKAFLNYIVFVLLEPSGGKNFVLFYKSSIGPIVVYYNFDSNVFKDILIESSDNKERLNQKSEVLFEK